MGVAYVTWLSTIPWTWGYEIFENGLYGLEVIGQNVFTLRIAPPRGENVKRLENTKFFARPDACVKFGEFLGMFKPPKMRSFTEKE